MSCTGGTKKKIPRFEFSLFRIIIIIPAGKDCGVEPATAIPVNLASGRLETTGNFVERPRRSIQPDIVTPREITGQVRMAQGDENGALRVSNKRHACFNKDIRPRLTAHRAVHGR